MIERGIVVKLFDYTSQRSLVVGYTRQDDSV